MTVFETTVMRGLLFQDMDQLAVSLNMFRTSTYHAVFPVIRRVLRSIWARNPFLECILLNQKQSHPHPRLLEIFNKTNAPTYLDGAG